MLVHNSGVSSELVLAGSPLSRERLRQAYPEFTAGDPDTVYYSCMISKHMPQREHRTVFTALAHMYISLQVP
jgi:hypothetical protein